MQREEDEEGEKEELIKRRLNAGVWHARPRPRPIAISPVRAIRGLILTTAASGMASAEKRSQQVNRVAYLWRAPANESSMQMKPTPN